MSWPSSSTAPELGCSSATTTRPIVVLPQPDSPTRPNVSPAVTVNETLDTACTAATLRCRIAPAVTGNSLTRSRTSSRGARRGRDAVRRRPARPGGAAGRCGDRLRAGPYRRAPAPRGAVDRVPAGEQVRRGLAGERRLVGRGTGRWPGCTAARTGSRPAGRARSGGSPPMRQQPLPAVLAQPRNARRAGHGCTGGACARTGSPVSVGLDHPARVHHLDPVRVPGDHAHVVRDQQHRHAEPVLEVMQQGEDLRLDGDVQRGGRLVGDQQLGLAAQRHRDHHPLAQPAGELVRVVAEPLGRPGQADQAEHLGRPGHGRRPCSRPCAAGPARPPGSRSSWWGPAR